jgi:hypothetical protein
MTGEVSVHDRRKREGEVWRQALLISVALHVLVFLLWPWGGGGPESPFAAAGPREADDLAAEGIMQAVSFRSAPPDAVQPPAVPVLTLDVPEPLEIEPDALPEVDLAAPELPEPGQGSTDGSDPDDDRASGLPGAAGAGDGGTTDEGRFRFTPATPRGMIIPPTHQALRGRQVEIWVFVDDAGRVVPDSTRLDPPTSDRGLNQQLVREASQWVFEPAREGGTPIAAWWSFRVGM